MGVVSLREWPSSGGRCLDTLRGQAAGSRRGTESSCEGGQEGLWAREGLCTRELRERLEAILVQLLPPGRPLSSVPLPPPGSFLHTSLTLVSGLQPRSSHVCRLNVFPSCPWVLPSAEPCLLPVPSSLPLLCASSQVLPPAEWLPLALFSQPAQGLRAS